MADQLKPLYERFPGREDEIRGLYASNNAFNGLCRVFCELEAQIGRLEGSVAAVDSTEGDALRHRQSALAQEMLALMQQKVRV